MTAWQSVTASWATVKGSSPVPGGLSIIRKSKEPQSTSLKTADHTDLDRTPPDERFIGVI